MFYKRFEGKKKSVMWDINKQKGGGIAVKVSTSDAGGNIHYETQQLPWVLVSYL